MADAAEKKSFEQFLSNVPDAPSSAFPTHEPEEAAAGDAADPLPAPAKRDAKGQFVSTGEEPSSTPSPEPTPDAKTPSTGDPPALDDVRAALAAGDLDTLAELLGEDPALYDEKTTKWAARNRREAKIKAERDSTAAKAEAVVQRWSPVSNLVLAAETDPSQLFPLIELLTGKSADQAWTDAIRARGTHDPRVPALQKRLADQDAALTEAQKARAEAADRAFFETLRDEVPAGDVVRQIDGWERRVADVLRESVDPDLGEPKLSIKQAVARVVRQEREEFERRAKIFGAETVPATKTTKTRAPERAGKPSSGAKVRKVTREEWLAARSNG